MKHRNKDAVLRWIPVKAYRNYLEIFEVHVFGHSRLNNWFFFHLYFSHMFDVLGISMRRPSLVNNLSPCQVR